MKAIDLIQHGFEVKEETFKMVATCKATGVRFDLVKGPLAPNVLFKIGKHLEMVQGARKAK